MISLNMADSDKASAHYARRFRPRLWPTLAAFLLIPLFIAAGFWQWNKASLKAERQQELDARSAQAAMPVPHVLVSDAQQLHYRKVVARGHYETPFQILIDNRTYREQAGYHVITPLRLEGSDMRLLVNRGWVPALAEHRQVPAIATPGVMVEVSGTAVIPDGRFFTLGSGSESGNGQWPDVWQNLDLEHYRKLVDFPLQPIVIQLDPASPAGGFVRAWSRPDERRQINLGYALQWWGFAATTLVLWLVLNYRRAVHESRAQA